MTTTRPCREGAQAPPKGPFDVSFRLRPSRASRLGSAHPHHIERKGWRGSAHLSPPNLSRLRLSRRCRSRHHLFRDGIKHLSPKLLVRRARPTVSLLAGTRALVGGLFP